MGKRRAPQRRRSAAARGGSEWIGGRLSPPFFITDRDEPYRIFMDLWMEFPSGLVVGQRLLPPEEAGGTLGQTLQTAMEQPLAGPPRRPDTIRVADATLAAEVRSAIGDTIPITIAPTPELDDLIDMMAQAGPGGEADSSYLGDGRIAPDAVAGLFQAAKTLYRDAPWEVARDHQVLRLDIPTLGVEGACLSIIGNHGQSLGFIIFPSAAGYEAFRRYAESPPAGDRIDLGTDWLALGYYRGADLPASMRREAKTNGWARAGNNAWPVVERRESDGLTRPLVQRDVEIVTATALALPALMAKYRGAFKANRFEPVAESYFDSNGLEVRLTLPHEAAAAIDTYAEERPSRVPAGRDVGRNDPCPCGSGRKYKKCHLRAEEQTKPAANEFREADDPDESVVQQVLVFGRQRFDEAMDFFRDFDDPAEAIPLAVPWMAYHYRIDGRTVLEWFLDDPACRFSDVEREWVASQQAAWLSIWEVTAVQPGVGLALRDLLSGETRDVRERSASQSLVVHDTILARVVDHAGTSLIAGFYPRLLPPRAGADVVRRARGRLQRKGAVPVERLRAEPIGRYLIKSWEQMVRKLLEQAAVPQRLGNTDGDELLMTTDHFKIAPGAERIVEAKVAALEGAEPPLHGEDPAVYVFVRESTVVGQVEVSGGTLRVQTNSRERADALRRRLETACGKQIVHRAREHADPLSSKVQPSWAPEPPDIPQEELARVMREFKERHYAGWVDESLPALNGKTPREAARTAKGRTALQALLKDMEHSEQRLPPGQAFDFGRIRRELRLD